MSQIRLQKFIADCGVTSRRKAEDLIIQGRVQLNGSTVRELGTKVDTENDVVSVDEQHIELSSVKRTYIVMHKPRGIMCTLNDPEGRKTVMDLCMEIPERIYPVGRLDYLSEGLLVLTNDGEVANMIMHPSFSVTKVYEVKVFGAVTAGMLKKIRNGVQTEEGFLKPQSVRVIKQLKAKTWLEFRLGEGRNREIRRICEACELTVDKLKRIAIEGLTVEGIAAGKFRYITKKQLLECLGLDANGQKVKEIEYLSPKKSVNLIKKRRSSDVTLANDKAFVKFRKDTYYDSLKQIEMTKDLKEKRERRELYEAKERDRAVRLERKKKRDDKKSDKKKFAHAVIVK